MYDLKKAEKILTDNGVEADEAQTVLQAVGYALLDKELYPAKDTFRPLSFINDAEKMVDFFAMSKEAFLGSYSYLSEGEYDQTAQDVLERTFKCAGNPKIKVFVNDGGLVTTLYGSPYLLGSDVEVIDLCTDDPEVFEEQTARLGAVTNMVNSGDLAEIY